MMTTTPSISSPHSPSTSPATSPPTHVPVANSNNSHADQHHVQPPPPPPGWTVYRAFDGRPYYAHLTTRHTQWHYPYPSPSPLSTSSSSASTPATSAATSPAHDHDDHDDHDDDHDDKVKQTTDLQHAFTTPPSSHQPQHEQLEQQHVQSNRPHPLLPRPPPLRTSVSSSSSSSSFTTSTSISNTNANLNSNANTNTSSSPVPAASSPAPAHAGQFSTDRSNDYASFLIRANYPYVRTASTVPIVVRGSGADGGSGGGVVRPSPGNAEAVRPMDTTGESCAVQDDGDVAGDVGGCDDDECGGYGGCDNEDAIFVRWRLNTMLLRRLRLRRDGIGVDAITGQPLLLSREEGGGVLHVLDYDGRRRFSADLQSGYVWCDNGAVVAQVSTPGANTVVVERKQECRNSGGTVQELTLKRRRYSVRKRRRYMVQGEEYDVTWDGAGKEYAGKVSWRSDKRSGEYYRLVCVEDGVDAALVMCVTLMGDRLLNKATKAGSDDDNDNDNDNDNDSKNSNNDKGMQERMKCSEASSMSSMDSTDRTSTKTTRTMDRRTSSSSHTAARTTAAAVG